MGQGRAPESQLIEIREPDMNVAWLAVGIIKTEFRARTLVSLDRNFEDIEFEIVLYYRKGNDSKQAKRVFEYLLSGF